MMSGGFRSTFSAPTISRADRSRELRLRRLVDGGAEDGAEVEARAGAVGLRDPLRDPFERPFHELHDLYREGAHGSAEAGGLGDDVVGVARVQAGDGDDRGLGRRDVAGHHRLDRAHEVRGDDDRVHARLGAGAVRADPLDVDVEERAARHHRPRAGPRTCRRRASAGCGCRRSCRTGTARRARPRSSPARPRALPRRAGR